MPHRHVQYTQVHPDRIEAELVARQVHTRSARSVDRRGILAGGTDDHKLRWLGVGGHELSWGVTSTPRRGAHNAEDRENGARVFVQGKVEHIEEAARLLREVISSISGGPREVIYVTSREVISSHLVGPGSPPTVRAPTPGGPLEEPSADYADHEPEPHTEPQAQQIELDDLD